jgi:hypothetical protein
VHVVLLNTNGWRDTVECLESVLRSDYDNLAVIVVDNASTDGSLERLGAWARGHEPGRRAENPALDRQSWPPVPKPVECAVVPASEFRGDGPRVTFVASSGNIGFAGGNNLALRPLVDTRREGYVLVLNNDTVIAPDAVTALVRALRKDELLAAVGGVILDYWKPDLVQVVGGGRMSHVTGSAMLDGGQRRDDVREPAPNSLGYVSGACVLIRLETLRRVGLLDERYFIYAEDADWGVQMRAQGYQLGCAMDAIVWHKGSQTMVAGSPFQDYHLVLSSLQFVRKNAPQWVPVAAMYSIVRCLAPKLVRFQWTRARAVLRAYAAFVRGR